MRDEAERTIDRLVEDNARANAEAEETWAVLDDVGIDVQTDVTLAEAVRLLVRQRDEARADVEWTMQTEAAVRDALTAQRDAADEVIGDAWDAVPDEEKSPGDTLAGTIRKLVTERDAVRFAKAYSAAECAARCGGSDD